METSANKPYLIENPVGRLIITRMPEPPSMDDAKCFAADLARTMIPHMQTRVLLCSDFRNEKLYPKEVADFMIGMMRVDNLVLERAGILVCPNSTGLQVFNAIRHAGALDRRKAAVDPVEIHRFLAEIATPPEALAAAQHLGLPT